MSDDDWFDRDLPNTPLALALDWLQRGAVGLIPLWPNSKNIQAGFGPNTRMVCSESAARHWWGGARPHNLGVVLGPGVVVLDFEERAAFAAWRSGPGAAVRTVIETSRGGHHVFFRGGGFPNLKHPVVELKVSGVCCVAPSVVEGVRYRRLIDCGLEQLTHELLPAELAAAWARMQQRPEPGRAARPARQLGPARQAGPGRVADIKARIRLLDEARKICRELKPRTGRDDSRWWMALCPFHNDNERSLWIDAHRGLWKCHSNNCPTNDPGAVGPAFATARAHDVIDWLSLADRATVQEVIAQYGGRA